MPLPSRYNCLRWKYVNIPWEYPDSAGMSTVSWEHIDASNSPTTILVQAAGAAAKVIDGYNIRHNTNGNVTITAATVANSGTYRITVAYSSATTSFTDDVVVNVYGGLSRGGIAGIVIGGVVGLGAFIAAIWDIIRRGRSNRTAGHAQPGNAQPGNEEPLQERPANFN